MRATQSTKLESKLGDRWAARGGTPEAISSREANEIVDVHDLGNLIQIAQASFRRLAREPHVSESDFLQPIVDAGSEALKKAATMVRRRLHFAQARNDSLDSPETEHVNVRDCIVELERILRSAIGPTAFQFAVRLQSDLPQVRCDRQGLQNALLNLIFNARDAMPDGGVISLEAVSIDNSSGPIVQLRIEDEGVGMTDETMLRAFEPFFTTKGKGLGGVGLPMVKHFAESHGGSVRLYSTIKSGTSVVLSLPGMIPAMSNIMLDQHPGGEE